ncbi:hypothetical protein [Nocardia rosealba]|uniref:hypothetical protein n=1 Tax=Nocardia TaxID=1817 RepID=UPI001CD950E1|nr:hypothetical protein [Nocardia rosealba]MCA2206284.1 hypothetical protein [Nocardia rosealba]
MRSRIALHTAVAATALGLALAGAGTASAAPADPIRHGHHNHPGLLSGSASAGSAAAGSAARGSAELAGCLLLEVVVPLPLCLLLS